MHALEHTRHVRSLEVGKERRRRRDRLGRGRRLGQGRAAAPDALRRRPRAATGAAATRRGSAIWAHTFGGGGAEDLLPQRERRLGH